MKTPTPEIHHDVMTCPLPCCRKTAEIIRHREATLPNEAEAQPQAEEDTDADHS